MDRGLAEVLEVLSARTGTVEILSDANHDLLAGSEDCSSFNLNYTVHAPTTDLNIASCREPIRKASLDLLWDVCRKAGEIGAGCVVVHPGFSPWLELKDRSFQGLQRSLETLSAIQEEFGVPIAVENMGTWEVCHFRDPGLIPLLRDLGLSFCLDVGHAHLNGNLEAFLSAGSPNHVHLHDNNGSVDDHMALGGGTIDFSAVLPCLPTDVSWILEVPQVGWFDRSAGYVETLNPGCQGNVPHDSQDIHGRISMISHKGGHRSAMD